MFSIDLDHAIATLVEHSVPRGSPQGLYVRVRIGFTNYAAKFVKGKTVPRQEDDVEEPAEVYTTAHFLFSRPSNYTKVWCYIGDVPYPTLDQWKMTSYHDSCWRSDGFSKLNQEGFNLRDAMLLPDQLPATLSTHTYFDRVQRAEIEDAPGNDQGRPHHTKVVSCKILW